MNGITPFVPPQSKLPARVWILGWISLFADIASEMVYPIIPIYVTVVLRAPVAALGAIEGFAEAIVSFMKGWSGWHSDRSGKRVPYVQWGYGLSAIGKPLMALAQVGLWGVVFLARSTDRVGKGLRTTARDALIVDAVEKSQYGRAFGLHRTMDTTGAFLGGLLCLTLLAVMPGNLRGIFLIAILPGFASVALTFLLKDKPVPGVAESKVVNLGTIRDMPKGYWRAIAITLIFALANSSDTFLLLRANDLFSKSLKTNPDAFGPLLRIFSNSTIGLGPPLILTTLAYVLYNITYVGFSYPAGVLSDRIGRWWVIAVGYVLYAGVYAGFAFATTSTVWFLFAIYGIYQGLTDGVGKALVADYAPAHARGTALGLFYMSAGFLVLLGNVIAGALWDLHGPQATFFFGSSLAVVAVLLIPLTRKLEGPRKLAT